MGEIDIDMKRSADAFSKLIWPIVSSWTWVGSSDLLQMENVVDSKFASILDMKAGIDGWLIEDGGMIGIASRIQVGDIAYNTFTIRLLRDSGATTEYAKRVKAIEAGKYVYPHFTIQAYVKTWGGPVLSVGMAKTIDIISFIKNGHHSTNRTTNAYFAACPWSEMKLHGYEVLSNERIEN